MDKISIVIVDDEVDLIEILVDELMDAGIIAEFITFDNPLKVLEFFAQCQDASEIDLILSDINMPGMDGFKMYTEIKKLQKYVPIIFLSGYGNKEKVCTALQVGAFDFIDKPFKTNELVCSVKAALKRREKERKYKILKKKKLVCGARVAFTKRVGRPLRLSPLEKKKKRQSKKRGGRQAQGEHSLCLSNPSDTLAEARRSSNLAAESKRRRWISCRIW